MRRQDTFAPLLAAALVAASAALQAQPEGQSGEKAAQHEPQAQAPLPASSGPVENSSNAAAPAAPQGAGKGSAGSPFEYEPSEDISEDLSVSFPVDI